jgi:hypothetical protein
MMRAEDADVVVFALDASWHLRILETALRAASEDSSGGNG